MFLKKHWIYVSLGALIVAVVWFGLPIALATEYRSTDYIKELFIPLPTLDTADYDARLLALAHASASTTLVFTGALPQASSTPFIWPVKAPYPRVGALLPFKRIVAYYGNFYDKRMGVLGEYPEDVMLEMLSSTTAKWTAADPNTPAIPAIQYIAVVAQHSPGKDGKYILRMPDSQIDHALNLASRINGIVFLDVQVGQSTLENELPKLEKYLKMPHVHLAIDPEFSMKKGERPGTVIGTFDAADINYAAQYLAELVNVYKLPPKVLVVHRFTQKMITNYKNITPLPEVQIVIDMDGFGSKAKKYGTYKYIVAPEPVQFTGIKLFYKNDTRPPADGLLSPEEIFALTPIPIYIQYQ